MGYSAMMAISSKISKKGNAVNPANILTATDHAMVKMLEQNLNKKDGPTVQSLCTTSREFIVTLVIILKILIKFDAAS